MVTRPEEFGDLNSTPTSPDRPALAPEPAPSGVRACRVYPGRAELSPADRRTLREMLGPYPGPQDSPEAILYEYEHLADVRLCIIPFHPPVFEAGGTVRCGCGQADCTSDPGKHPAVKWRDIGLPTVGIQLAEWRAKMAGASNYALIMGGCDPELCAIDYDPRNGGDVSLAELIAKHGPMPETWLDETSRAGGHYFFERPAGLPDTAGIVLAPGVDFLQRRHPTIIAPSVHQSGKVYRWRPGRAPWETRLAPLPAWVVDMIQEREKAKAAVRSAAATTAATSVYIPPADLDRRELTQRARKYVARMRPSIQGQDGSGALMAVCGKLMQGFALEWHEAWPILCEYNALQARPAWEVPDLERALRKAERQPDPQGRPKGYMLAAPKDRRLPADVPEVDKAGMVRLGLWPGEDGRLDLDAGDQGEDDAPDGRDEGPGPRPDPTPPQTPGAAASVGPAEPNRESLPEPPDTPAPVAPGDPREDRGPPRPDGEEDKILRALLARAESDAEDAEAARPTGDRWAAAYAAGPGVYVDRDPGLHPDLAAQRAILAGPVRHSLTVLRGREECDRGAERMWSGQGANLLVASYPARTSDNCQNHIVAGLAEERGLPATSAVCPDCRFQEGCTFLADLAYTRKAPHRVATAARVSVNSGETDGCDATFIGSNALDVIAPFASTPELEPGHLRPLVAAARMAASKARRKSTPEAEAAAVWWDAFAQQGETVYSLAREGQPTQVPTRSVGPPPPRWTATLWSRLYDGVNTPPEIPRDLVRILAAAVSGAARIVILHAGDQVKDDLDRRRRVGQDGWSGPDGAERPARRLAAAWCSRVPDGTVIVAEDVNPADLSRVVGGPVVDVTDTTAPSWADRAMQVPERQTAGRRPKAVAATVGDYLARYAPTDRWAVVVPGNMTRAQATARAVLELLPEADRDRVTLTSWYSEEPLPPVDRVLCLGAPVPPPHRVRQWLVQTVRWQAALRPGDWGVYQWQGVTAEDGEIVTVDCWGYREPDWAEGLKAVVRERMRCRLAAVRVPVIVVSDMEMGLPLSAAPARGKALSDTDRRLLDALGRLVAKQPKTKRKGKGGQTPSLALFAVSTAEPERADPDAALTAKSARGSLLNPLAVLAVNPGPAPPAVVTTEQVAAEAGIPTRTARHNLAALAEAGWVRRVGSRLGWALPAAATRPTRPAAVADPTATAPGAEAVPGLGTAGDAPPLSARAVREAERAALAELMRATADEFDLQGVPGCPTPSTAPASAPDSAAAQPPAEVPPEQEDLFDPYARKLAGEHSLRPRRDPRGHMRVAACSPRGFAIGWSQTTYPSMDAAKAACESRAFRWLPPLSPKPEAVGPVVPAATTDAPGPACGPGATAAKPADKGKRKAKPKRPKETASDLELAARKSHRPAGLAAPTHGTVNGCPVFRLRCGKVAATADPTPPEAASGPSAGPSGPPPAAPAPSAGEPPEAA